MEITSNELFLLADVFNGTTYLPFGGTIIHSWELEAMSSCIEGAAGTESVGEKWNVSIQSLVQKLGRMPNLTKVELLNHIIEGQNFHSKPELLKFLNSIHVTFRPLTSPEQESKFFLGVRLASGELIANRHTSHVPLTDFLPVAQALNKIVSHNRSFIEAEIVFDREVGMTTCVRTDNSDTIVSAQRTGRPGLTRFARQREPEPSKSVFVVLKRDTYEKYVLITGFVGGKPEPEPFDERMFSSRPDPIAARDRSKQFWAGHALVWNPINIVSGTETAIPPTYFKV